MSPAAPPPAHWQAPAGTQNQGLSCGTPTARCARGVGRACGQTALMRKDLELAIDVAGDVGLPVTAAAKWFLDVACTAGFSDADFASVAQVLRESTPEPGGVAPAS
jgi:hypothetical protein